MDMWSFIEQFIQESGDPCLLCRAPTRGSGLCPRCASTLPKPGNRCRQCALPLADPAARYCGECLASPPAFDATVAPFIYEDPVDRLISAFKFHAHLAAGRVLACQLARRTAGRKPDLLLPMPLHPRRLKERGFNQAAEICRTLSTLSGASWHSGYLARTRVGASQRESSRRERQRNVRNAFRWVAHQPCPPCVALVDDVMTTGATARAAAACLKGAGAQWVEIWAIARTPRD